jgi:hypothetical protein
MTILLGAPIRRDANHGVEMLQGGRRLQSGQRIAPSSAGYTTNDEHRRQAIVVAGPGICPGLHANAPSSSDCFGARHASRYHTGDSTFLMTRVEQR